ncbi:hypothetical protein B296_00032724 [Ensete ventricosum]|uniref:Uncharacterized protein n=1 Tax=Ensete ventricosum TaxID=4639 RepID=A0A426YZI2_ENSVE|nr:hypothetical protein B296_00032724 [Ensete ventricosum]
MLHAATRPPPTKLWAVVPVAAATQWKHGAMALTPTSQVVGFATNEGVLSPAMMTTNLGSMSRGATKAFSGSLDAAAAAESRSPADFRWEHASTTRATAMRIIMAPKPPKR